MLDALTGLFWRKGYAQTTMADIVEVSGVHKPTLYRVFGTKDEIFATVLRRYLDAQMAMIDGLVERSLRESEPVRHFLASFLGAATRDGTRDGCLMVMASNELSGTLPGYEGFASAYRDALRERLLPLTNAATSDPTLATQRAELLATYLAGTQVAIRAGANDQELQRITDAMASSAGAW